MSSTTVTIALKTVSTPSIIMRMPIITSSAMAMMMSVISASMPFSQFQKSAKICRRPAVRPRREPEATVHWTWVTAGRRTAIARWHDPWR